MKRGEIWTVAGGSDYARKPRPVALLQDQRFDSTASIVHSYLMADKITTVTRTKLGRRIGTLDADDLARLSRSVILFLNLLETP